MSRTYRRKDAEKAFSYYFDFSPSVSYRGEIESWWVRRYLGPEPDTEEGKAKAMRKYIAEFYTDSYSTMTTPMWWIRMCHQVPYRRKVRDLNRNLVKMKHLDEMESTIYPDWKRPHNYYW